MHEFVACQNADDVVRFRVLLSDRAHQRGFAAPCVPAGSPCGIARRGIESSERLRRYRCVVERSLAWLLGCRRLGVRYERRVDLLTGLLHPACPLVCLSLPPVLGGVSASVWISPGGLA